MINSTPLISICIPTYNGSHYIKKCIECCIHQSYKNIEIIINDDGSNDDTVSIIQQFAQKDDRIKFTYNEKNCGLVANWNRCLDLASGTYIKWLFQDDWMELNAIESFYEIAKQGYDVVVSKRNYELPQNATIAEKDYYYRDIKKLENYFNTNLEGYYFSNKQIVDIAVSNIALNFIGEPSLLFYKKDLIQKVGNYDLLFHQICDLEHCMRLASIAGIYVINKPLCSFVVHANSTSSSNINSKYFYLVYFETAHYAYKLIHHKAFSTFKLLASFNQKLKLKLYYKFKMFEAKRIPKSQTDLMTYKKALIDFPFLKSSIFDVIVLHPLFYFLKFIKK